MGPDRLRCLGGHRRGHLHHHGVDRGRHHRARHLDLVRPRSDRLRVGGPVLRRVRVDSAGGRQCLHVLLCELRRGGCLDHRLGPGARVRRRRCDRRQELVDLSGRGVRLRRWRDRAGPTELRLGCRGDRRDRHHVARTGHQAVVERERRHHADKGRRGARGHRASARSTSRPRTSRRSFRRRRPAAARASNRCSRC